MEDKKQVQEALNRSLSGLSENPYLAQRVIAQAKGETKVKKKSIGALTMAMVLALAMMGTAYALFSSQVAAFFAGFYGQDLGDWLQSGKIAQLNETVDLGNVTVTLNEVVYRNRGMYGVGTVKASNEKDVLLPDAIAEDGPYYFGQQDGSNEQAVLAHRLADQAQRNGGRLLTVCVQPEQVGVDGGTMLHCDCFGYFDEWNEDGSLTFSFEVEDGRILEDGETYQLLLDICVGQMDQQGNVLPDTRQHVNWTVHFRPVVMVEPTLAASPAAETPASIEYALDGSAVYMGYGSLPVYRAIETDIAAAVRPEWFNQSGIAEQKSESSFEFADHAILQFGKDHLFYKQYTDEMYDYNAYQRERFGMDAEPMMERVPDLSYFISAMASEVETFAEGEDVQLEHTQLTWLSLADAQGIAEDMLARLGLRGYSCSNALDMSVDRIHSLGEYYNHYWYDGDACTNQPRMDYSTATADDEGYYLVYTLMGLPDSDDTHQRVSLFIDRGGIAFMNLRSTFSLGDVLYVPSTLATPEEAAAVLNAEASASFNGKPVVSVSKMTLVYRAVRAEEKADGMTFVPVWRIEYKDRDSVPQSYNCWGEVNAINGKLIDAIFK